MKEKKLLTKDNLYISIIAAVLSFTLTMFAPLEIYLTNIKEFWFGVKLLMPVLLLVFAGVLITSLIVLNLVAVFSKKVAYVLTYIYFVLVALLYIQGNFVVSTLGSLDGTSIDWNVVNPDRIISAVLWIVGIVLVIVIYCRIGSKEKLIKTVSYISIALVLLETVTLVSVAIMNKSQFANKYFYYATQKDEMRLSDKENVVIFVLDSFDSTLFNDTVSQYPECKNTFDGFTYYPDTLGCFGYTELALPQILTGIKYDNQTNYLEYMRDGFDSNPLYTRMIDNGWNMGIYTTNYLVPCDFVKNLENTICVDRVTVSSKSKLIMYEYKLVGYKYLPYELKRLCWFDPAILNSLRSIDEEVDNLYDYSKQCYDWYNDTFLGMIDQIEITEDDGVFRLYHLTGTHPPFLIDEYGRRTGVEVELEEYGYDYHYDYETDEITAARGNIYILNQYFEKLKAAGIYDKTAIIIMADHGLNRGDGKTELKQNPLFMIKGIGESHEFTVNERPLTYENLRVIYENMMQGKTGEDITVEIDNKERYFGYYRGNVTAESTNTVPITEYVLNGNANDSSNMVPTGVIYKPGKQ